MPDGSGSPAGERGGDRWNDDLRGLLADAAARPAPAATRSYSVLQLLPADPAHGVLAVGRAFHGFTDEASASAHALDRGWRSFAVLPSRHVPPALHAEVQQEDL